MTTETVLITGGAGYIGSHVVQQLLDAGTPLVVLDDLSTGFRDALQGAPLVEGNTGDADLVGRVLRDYRVATVLHFAARTIVPESVADPLRYYANNACATRTLLEGCVRNGVKRFVFSSTAAVYGIPEDGRVGEDAPTHPINPYGSSKLMSEWMLRDLAAAGGPRYVALRYFNATLLFKVACEVATGQRDHVDIFGTDYATPDGTGVRDYIHVEDVATAHLRALEYLRDGGASTTLNCGYGHGYSMREVIAAVERAHGARLRAVERPRRAGDPPSLIADVARIGRVLQWTPRHDDLDVIAATSLAWERRLAQAR